MKLINLLSAFTSKSPESLFITICRLPAWGDRAMVMKKPAPPPVSSSPPPATHDTHDLVGACFLWKHHDLVTAPDSSMWVTGIVTQSGSKHGGKCLVRDDLPGEERKVQPNHIGCGGVGEVASGVVQRWRRDAPTIQLSSLWRHQRDRPLLSNERKIGADTLTVRDVDFAPKLDPAEHFAEQALGG
jgi:hypothetical protein